MDSAPLALDSVVASVTFVVPDGEKPFIYNYDPPPAGRPKRGGRYEARAIEVHDARPLAASLSLDREGFVLRRHQTSVADLYDEAALRQVYYREMEALVARETGAARVLVFDHTIRTGHAKAEGGPLLRDPVTRAHNDYTEISGPQRVRDLLPDEAERLLQRRFAVVNVWRPIRAPILRTPLALCDARSIGPGELVASDLIYRDRLGETYALAHGPGQRWSWFPRMQRDEVVLIKCYDSDRSVARFAAHSAFEDPAAPADAPPRESIEIRTLAFF